MFLIFQNEQRYIAEFDDKEKKNLPKMHLSLTEDNPSQCLIYLLFNNDTNSTVMTAGSVNISISV